MLIILLTILIGLLVARFLLWRAKSANHFAGNNIPSAKDSLIFGSTTSSILKKRNIVYDVNDVYETFKGKSPVAGFFAFQTPYILLLDSTLIKICRKFKNNDFEVSKSRDPLMSLNPFFMRDDEWKQKRRDTDAAVSMSRIKTVMPRIEQSANNLEKYIVEQLAKNSSKIFNAHDLIPRYTCDAITSALYCADAESFESETPEMLYFARTYIRGIIDSLVSIFPRQMLSKKVVEYFTNTTREAVKLRIEQNRRNTSKIDDILAQVVSLLETRNYTEDELIAHCLTLYLDSYETSSVALIYALYRLGRNQNVQAKLRDELNEIDDDNLTFDKVNDLVYLDQVFYETLRLHPPLPYTTRICSEDWQIDGMKIEKGSSIWLPIHSIHRDAEYFHDPEDFFPERFDPENGGVKAFRDRCELIPFGDGLRICSGRMLAHAEVKTAIIKIVTKFNVFVDESTVEPLVVSPNEFMSHTEQKVFLRFERI